jgi:hypothetical protein
MAVGEKYRRSEMALLVLHSLPAQHEMYFYEEIRRRCMNQIAFLGVPLTERASAAGELLSEVMAKLLGVGSSSGAENELQQADQIACVSDDAQLPSVPSFQTNADDPEKDERVRWLIQEVGGRRALKHRFEDIRRRRWGRAQGLGYRTVQISALSNAGPETDRDEDILAQQEMRDGRLQEDHEDPHHDQDVRRAWIGMLAAASSRFKPHEDVRKLLDLLARDPDVQAGFGVEWPVRKIVEALNIVDPDPPWNDDRIENAKKRLRNWIGGMKRDHGLDQTDLMALFARYGRAAASGAGGIAPSASDLGTGTPSPKGAAHD